MHKAQRLNQANISITATRWCNRRCTHCYISPEELANRAFMDSETFRSVFTRVRELVALDQGLQAVEWELIGGEITSLPVEYWQENLPYALDQCRDFNQALLNPGSINVLSNLIFPDEGRRRDYLDLFAKYGDRPEMCLYTSWEPDTNRFGKNMALFDRWKETVQGAQVQKKILDVILTRSTVELGPEYLLETFLPLGINDFSIKMISPYGSGRSFWQPNMVGFDRMSDYLCRLLEIIPHGVTFTPGDEIAGAMFRGAAYQCIGNFRYDLAVEPDGLTTFNANQTTAEASVGQERIYLTDPDWSWKVLADNTSELDNKLSKYHPYCFQCEFHSFCAGGWYHYRIADPADVRAWDQGDCPGYKKLWTKIRERNGSFDNQTYAHRASLSLIKQRKETAPGAPAVLAEPTGAERFAELLKQAAGNNVEIQAPQVAGKPVIERLWAYQAIGVQCEIPAAVFAACSAADQRKLIEHLVYEDLYLLALEAEVVWSWVAINHGDPLAKVLNAARHQIEAGEVTDSLIAADHNTHLLRWVLRNWRPAAGEKLAMADPTSSRIQTHLKLERRLADRLGVVLIN